MKDENLSRIQATNNSVPDLIRHPDPLSPMPDLIRHPWWGRVAGYRLFAGRGDREPPQGNNSIFGVKFPQN